MLLPSLLLLFLSLSCHVSASFPGSYDSRLEELPYRLSQTVPEGLPKWLLEIYTPLHALSNSCLRDARVYQSGLKVFEPWAMRMLDSSSKLPSGLMMGHIHDLGSFDQCFASPSAPFPSQFCVIDFQNFMGPLRILHPDTETIIGGMPLHVIDPKLSFCLPASCSDRDITTHFSHVVAPWNMSARVGRYACTKPDSRPFDALDWAALLVVIILTLLVVTSTAYEIYCLYKDKGTARSYSRSRRVLLSFSLVTNTQRLCSTVDPSRSLTFLGGIRFLCMVWVIIGHHTLFNFLVPMANWITPYKEITKLTFSPLQNAMLAVDTFLVITGFLIAYFFLQEIGTNKRPFRLLPFYLHRIIRLTPSVSLGVLMAATLASRIGDGPLWQSFFFRQQEDCRNNGWTNLLFLNNYIHTTHQCISFTWYLCVDMHLYLLSPLVLFPLLKYRMFARVGLPLLLLAAILIDFFVVFFHKLPAGAVITRDLRTANNYHLEYAPTHTRAAPWLVGIGLGYLLHSLKATKFKLPQVVVALGWFTAVLLAVVSVCGVWYFHQDHQVLHYDVVQSTLYMSLHRVTWALAVAWLVFACETGNAGPIRMFLASRIFQPLGRLSFSLYMVHTGIQYLMVAAQKSPPYYSHLFMARDVLGELLLAVGLAVVLSLGVEAPLIRLEKALFQQTTLKDSASSEKREIKLNGEVLEVKTNSNNEAGIMRSDDPL